MTNARHSTAIGAEHPDGLLRLPIFVGFGATFAFVAVLLVWSYLAPLASATMAQGTVVVDTSRKSVQVLDPGVVKNLRVRDGDYVSAGQVLITLDSSRLELALQAAKSLLAMNIAQSARLFAERDALDRIEFPPTAAGLQMADFPEVTNGQLGLFKARRSALAGQIAALESEAAQSMAVHEGLKQQVASVQARISLTAQEFRAALDLARTGDGPRQRVTQVGLLLAELAGEMSDLNSRSAEAQHKAEHAKLDIERARAAFLEGAETELQVVGRERVESVERVASIEDQIQLHEIRAPVSGRVVNLAVHTVGGVIISGSPVLEIVPADDKLVIETQIQPTEIEHVKPGLPVEIRVNAYEAKRAPIATGIVESVSADRLIDRLRGTPYFLVRIEVGSTLSQLGSELRPGMAVEVMIFTGTHTVVDYLVGPFIRFFSSAMRE